MDWSTHVTVAAIVEDNGRFLVVEEMIDGRLTLNQPAGHVEQGETLEEAVVREALEETGLHLSPVGILGLYVAPAMSGTYSYYRVAFHCEVIGGHLAPQDPEIQAACWLDIHELQARAHQWRSPVVGRCLQDALAGIRHPLSLIRDMTHG